MSNQTITNQRDAVQEILRRSLNENITPSELTTLREFMRMTQGDLGEALACIEPSLRRGRVVMSLYENGHSPIPLKVGVGVRKLVARYVNTERQRVCSIRVPQRLKQAAC